MSISPKKKLCWNCDGSIPVAVEQCTYCGVSLKEGAEQAAQKNKSKPQPSFQPPYSMASMAKETDEKAPESPFGILKRQAEAAKEVNVEEDAGNEATSDNRSGLNTAFKPLLLLIGGSIFFLFGIALFLFSQEGQFTLSWNAERWYLYLFVGVAALSVGWSFLNSLEEASE